MYVSAIFDRTRAVLLGLLIALSLLVAALPVSAGYTADGYDFIDATNITWEQSVRVRLPGGGGASTFSITWE